MKIISRAIKAQLRIANSGKVEFNFLRKLVMKRFKSEYPDKIIRRELFKKEVDRLRSKSIIQGDSILQLSLAENSSCRKRKKTDAEEDNDTSTKFSRTTANPPKKICLSMSEKSSEHVDAVKSNSLGTSVDERSYNSPQEENNLSASESDREQLIQGQTQETEQNNNDSRKEKLATEEKNTTILLFYAYCNPAMTRAQQDIAITHCYKILSALGVSGRLRIGREGYNSTLTGSYEGIRAFTKDLLRFDPVTFGPIDFKFVDGLPANQRLKGLKVWPVTEIVTYGFDPADAPLKMRGTHLTPQEFHDAMMQPNTVIIDVRNFNETVLGKFVPPSSVPCSNHTDADGDRHNNNSYNYNSVDHTAAAKKKTRRKTLSDSVRPPSPPKVLDPCMRRSTEFPEWVENNRHQFEGKQVLMYCTAGVRCERASAFMRNKGIENVYQLEGGIHRYLDAFPEDGGLWKGKNYTFDKRFSHGAKQSEVISHCVFCEQPWDRYQAQKKCAKCAMEALLCRTCQRSEPPPPRHRILCPLCNPNK